MRDTHAGDLRRTTSEVWAPYREPRSSPPTEVFPRFGGVGLLDSVPLNLRGEWRGTTGLPAGVSPQGPGPGRAGRPIAEVAQALGISGQSIYSWRRQDRIDRGLEPGLTSGEKAELAVAQRRIAELETELQAMRRAMELVREVVPPKGGSKRSR
jgi:transposase